MPSLRTAINAKCKQCSYDPMDRAHGVTKWPIAAFPRAHSTPSGHNPRRASKPRKLAKSRSFPTLPTQHDKEDSRMTRQRKAVALGGAHGSQGFMTSVEYCPPEDRANQRAALLVHLRRHGSITTSEARRWYAIMSPASRVFELRRQGHAIATRRDPVQRCARYVMDLAGDHA